MRKRRIGTAKFFTLLLLLYHTSAKHRRLKCRCCLPGAALCWRCGIW
ncbi:Maff2 family mobile element protein [Luoshenia tenuis]